MQDRPQEYDAHEGQWKDVEQDVPVEERAEYDAQQGLEDLPPHDEELRDLAEETP